MLIQVVDEGWQFKVLRDGEVHSTHASQLEALNTAFRLQHADPDATVKVAQAQQLLLVAQVDEEPTPEPEPEPEPEPIPTDGTLLRDIAATLSRGEWRQVATKIPAEFPNFKAFQTVHGNEMQSGSADGMGWTERLIEHKGTLMLPLMRDFFTKALIVMDSAGNWRRINEPSGWSRTKSERRPFNRWFKEDGYACFAPADEKPAMGYVVRTSLDSPAVFERHGIAVGDSSMDSVGNFSMCTAWDRRWIYTPGGKLRSWGEGEVAWTDHYSHLPQSQRPSGFAGSVFFNPIRNEVMAIGGQYFGSNPDVSDRGWIIRPGEVQATLFNATFEDGTPILRLTSAQCRLLYHPITGEYLLLYVDGVMYRSDDGRVWRSYQDLRALKPWGNYEQYCPWTILEGTDVVVMVSHLEGVWLHKLLP